MPNIHTLTDHVKVGGQIGPVSGAAGTAQNGDWVDMAGYERVTFLVQTGVAGDTATIDAKVQQASSSTGTGAKDVTGAAITQRAAHATNNDKLVLAVTVSAPVLDEGFQFVRIVVTSGVAASLVSAVGILYRGGDQPAKDKGLTEDVRKVR